MQSKLVTAVVAAAISAGAATTQAHEAGDIILRAGIATVDPDGNSEAITLPTAPPTVLGGGVEVDDDTQLGLMGAFMVTDRWGIELLASTPFEHDISQPDLGLDAGKTSHLPPTLSLQWYPRGGNSGWQPYVGIGVNYTYFFDEEVDPALGDALGAVLGASSAELELEDSFGLAGQVGVDIPLKDGWMLNAGIWYVDIDTTADLRTDVGTVSFDVDIDPWVYNVGIAYRF